MLGGTAVVSDEAVLRPHPTQEASGAPSPPSFGSEAVPFSPQFFFFFLLQKALWFPFGLRLGRDSRVLKVCLVATERGFWQEP